MKQTGDEKFKARFEKLKYTDRVYYYIGYNQQRGLFKDRRVVTPLEVKRALDKALLDHKVRFLTGTFPSELLVSKDGTPGGLTIASRSGRQAVRARIVIDATPDAALARQEMFSTFTILLDRLGDIRLTDPADPLEHVPSSFLRGLKTLNLTFDVRNRERYLPGASAY